MKKRARELLRSPRTARGDGTPFFYLSREYFDPKGFRGLSIPARVLLKYLTIETCLRRYEGRLAHSILSRSGLSPRSQDKYLSELRRRELVSWATDYTRTGNRYVVAPALKAASEGFTLACNPYRFGTLSFLSVRELFLFECLTFWAYEESSLRIRATVDELIARTGLSFGAVKDARKKFESLGLLAWNEQNAPDPRPKVGNRYLVNPMLLWGPQRKGLAYFDSADSLFLPDEVIHRHSDLSCAPDRVNPAHSDLSCAVFGSFLRRRCVTIEATDPAHSDLSCAQIYSSIPLLVDGATRHRCPTGQDPVPPTPPQGGKEGVRQKADRSLPRKKGALRAQSKQSEVERIRALKAQAQLAVQRENTEREKPAAGGGEQVSCPPLELTALCSSPSPGDELGP